MSRNFELLQQLRKQLDAVPIIEPVGIAPVVDKSKVGHPRIVGFDPNCSTPEVLHKFVENVFLSRGKLSPRLVAFAGLESGDCCSRMITELAVTLTRLDIGKVCLVDAYFHSPSLAEFFDLGNPCGLVEASRLGGPILNFTFPVRNGSLTLLPWGSYDAGATTHLAIDQVKMWLDELRRKFGYVLVNVPPLNWFAVGIAFGQVTDGLVPVLDRSSTQPAGALRQLERLRESKVRICGAVMNYTHFNEVEADAAHGLFNRRDCGHRHSKSSEKGLLAKFTAVPKRSSS